MRKTVALLPIANSAVECLSHIFDRQNLRCRTPANHELLNVAAGAVAEYQVERNIAYDPFDIFWGNPDEPKHSRLLWYFINPHAEHDCGPFLLRAFLSALKISRVELPVDRKCEVTREDEHMDLLITRAVPDGKYAIIIENKVNGAVDQKEQLQNYYRVVRRRGFEDDQIFVCYLTLRGGSPSSESVGSLKTRPTERTFKEHIVPWLEGVLRDRDKWPVKMSEGMSDNLKHYLDLIKWRLNKEKIMQMNDKIFEALQKAADENRLPTLAEITAVKESAQALEDCYRRLKRAETISAVQRLLHERYKLKQTNAYHEAYPNQSSETTGWWLETAEWYDDLKSTEYCFGFSVGGIVIVALGEDQGGIYTGYAAPKVKGKANQFEKFVRKEEPSVFDGVSSDWWFSYTHPKNVDGTHPGEIDILARKLIQMYQNMERLVTKFKKLPQPSS